MGFRVQGLGFRVHGSGFRVSVRGPHVQGSVMFRIQAQVEVLAFLCFVGVSGLVFDLIS